jgi:hypothetical protein
MELQPPTLVHVSRTCRAGRHRGGGALKPVRLGASLGGLRLEQQMPPEYGGGEGLARGEGGVTLAEHTAPVLGKHVEHACSCEKWRRLDLVLELARIGACDGTGDSESEAYGRRGAE